MTQRERVLYALLGLFFIMLMIVPGPVQAADIIVDATTPYAAGDGLCSLVEAIDNANADAAIHADCAAGSGADTITLRGDITLSGADIFTANGPNGLPSITSPIIIDGGGATISRAGSAIFRIFHIAAGGDLTLDGVTITGGLMDVGFNNGGGIYNTGTLTLLSTTVRDNRVASIFPTGGGIYNLGDLDIIDSVITSNQAESAGSVFDNGGGIYSQDPATLNMRNVTVSDNFAGEAGGGIWASGPVTLNNSIISGNSSGELAGGLLSFDGLVAAPMRIYNSVFSNNSTVEAGGAMLNGRDNVEIFGTTFSGNTVTGNPAGLGGAISNQAGSMTITNSQFTGNRALNGAVGGAISNSQLGTVTIRGSVFTGNSSGNDGGAMWTALAETFVFDSLISNNLAETGGGVYQGPSNFGGFTITRSTISDNTASFIGGGAASESQLSTLTIRNSTITGNESPTFGGGIGLNAGGVVDVSFSTVVDNDSTQFSNSVGGINAFAGTMTIDSTIIANNMNVDCSATNGSTSLGFNITTGSGDIAGTRWCSFIPLQATDILDTDPLVNALAANGSLGPTHTLQAGSPAIAAIPTDCPATLDGVDQRGVPRAAGSCDVGAIAGIQVTLPTVYFQTATSSINESDTAASQNIEVVVDNTAGNLPAPGSLPISVFVSITGSAVETRDYTAGIGVPTTFTVNGGNWPAPGTSRTFQIPVSALDDTDIEGTEDIQLVLTVIGPGVLDTARRAHTVTVLDNDGLAVAPTVPVVDPGVGVAVAGAIDIQKTGVINAAGTGVDWQITLTNGAQALDNVVITDTLIAALQAGAVTTTQGSVTTNGQTVSVAVGSLAASQTVVIGIASDIVAPALLTNTACVDANSLDSQVCVSGLALTADGLPAGVTSLPATGEPPRWRSGLLAVLASLTIVGLSWKMRYRAQYAAPRRYCDGLD